MSHELGVSAANRGNRVEIHRISTIRSSTYLRQVRSLMALHNTDPCTYVRTCACACVCVCVCVRVCVCGADRASLVGSMT